jgi:hypothetical protein
MTLRFGPALLLVTSWLVPAPGCVDETHEEEVDALGPEDPGVPRGPLHRPGQPCLTCHGGSGPAHHQFSIGGTVYTVQGQGSPPALGATVLVEDITGAVDTVQSNEVGNFYITVQEWQPTYPTLPQVTLGSVNQQMTTHVGRDGSCADCHQDPAGPTSAGHIYMMTGPAGSSDGGS